MTTDKDAGQELAGATAAINIARHVEIEEDNIASINDQIRELETDCDRLDSEIERCMDFIRSSKKTIRRHRRTQERLRLQRDIFEESALRLRKANHP